MDREQKSAAIAELTEDLKGAEAIFAIDYRGISVTQVSGLRRQLAEADAAFKVVKNRLAKRAAADAGTEGIDELLVGPTALTLIKGDAVIAAKAIATFTREHDVLAFKGGFMDGEALDADGFQAIARLPGLDVLRGQLVGLAASPITSLVRGLGSMVSGLAIALNQIAEQGLVTGEAPPAEPEPQEEAPPAEHAEQEAQPEESEQAPAQEPPGEDPAGSDSETSNDDKQEQEEPSGNESDD